METKILANKIFEIVNLLEENEGVALFASRKKGFEPWLKVELSGILNHYGTVSPEEKRIDIVFDDEWAISLKDRKKKADYGRSSVLENLQQLEEYPYNEYDKGCLVFLTFSPKGKKKLYDNNIKRMLKNNNRTYYKRDFNFNNKCFKNNNEGSIWFAPGKYNHESL